MQILGPPIDANTLRSKQLLTMTDVTSKANPLINFEQLISLPTSLSANLRYAWDERLRRPMADGATYTHAKLKTTHRLMVAQCHIEVLLTNNFKQRSICWVGRYAESADYKSNISQALQSTPYSNRTQESKSPTFHVRYISDMENPHKS
jgi:hypothetical protein